MPKSDPLALADALLVHAATAPDPAPLLAAARALLAQARGAPADVPTAPRRASSGA